MTPAIIVRKNYPAWSHRSVVEFYARKRSRVEDLYETERSLLLPALESCGSVLDVGCAAGSFFSIIRTLKPEIRYVGVDVSPKMVTMARSLYPAARFEVSDGSRLSFQDGAFDLVLCTGVLHHNPNYEEIIREVYRVAAKGCILDLPRLVTAPYQFRLASSYQVLKEQFPGQDGVGEDQTIVPYVLSNPQPLFEFLLRDLHPQPRAIAAVGHYGSPSESAVVPVKPVCFCVVYVGKGHPGRKRAKIWLDLPDDVMRELDLKDAEHLPAEGLEVILEVSAG